MTTAIKFILAIIPIYVSGRIEEDGTRYNYHVTVEKPKYSGIFGIKLPNLLTGLNSGSKAPFSWNTCGTPSDSVNITDLSVLQTSDLIFRVKGSGSLAQDITAPIKGKLELSKKMIWGWTPIPCMDGFGSCSYDDVCQLSPYTNTTCPPDMSSQSLPCSCPINKGAYSGTLDINLAVLKLPSWLEKGRYRVKATIADAHVEIICLKMDITVK